ncbi:unnamed protein product [Hymenolepis diminuta]|uniref:Uncharacterized protein n=1 Tax=Hymenolepis diminuta TaxID=6216 RepID=A0A564YH56_HYMDI|nr:unnamed protein product [Hymenolepis diminuta]
MSKTFNLNRHMTIYGGIKILKGGKWASPCDFLEINKQQRATCCVCLRSCEIQAPFSDRIIADSNEKWILYNKSS